MKKVTKARNNILGFSLAETLMAVLILLLVASVIAAGIPAAVSAYKNAVDGANAQTLLSTTVNALRSELSTASDVEVDPASNVIVYRCSRTGARTKLYNETGTIMVQDYYNAGSDPQPTPSRGLISETMTKKSKNSSENYGLAFSINTSPASDVISFAAVTVKDGTVPGASEVASVGPVTVRLIAPAS